MDELLTSVYEVPDMSLKYPGVELARENTDDSFEDFNKMFFDISDNKVEKLKGIQLPDLRFPSSTLTVPPSKPQTESQAESQTVSQSVKQPVKTSNIDKYVKEYLMANYGLDAIHASALVGVWRAESGLNPGIKSKKDSGSGIAQWTGVRHQTFKEYYEKLFGRKCPGITNTTLEEQIAVAMAEYQGRPGNWKDFLSRKDLQGATDSVLRGYENGGTNKLASIAKINEIYTNNGSGTYKKLMRDRLNYAERALKALRGGKLYGNS